MDQEEYEKKYHKYLTKNKLMLKQLRRYDDVHEQEVRFIAITITDLNSEKENKILNEIMNTKERQNLCVLRTLNYVKNSYLKYNNLRKEHHGIRNVVESTYNKLRETLANTLGMIRGVNTILNFDLAYVNSDIEFDQVTRTNHIRRVYLLELLPPEETMEHLFENYAHTKQFVPWNINEHADQTTLNHKWFSHNQCWRWNKEKQVWITNDSRPWYFENLPSTPYIKSAYEWNNLLTEVAEHEKMKQRVLLNAKIKQEAIIQKEYNSVYNRIKRFLFQNNKVHITNDIETNSYDDKTDTTTNITDLSI